MLSDYYLEIIFLEMDYARLKIWGTKRNLIDILKKK